MVALDSITTLENKRNQDGINMAGLNKLISIQQAKLDTSAQAYQDLEVKYDNLVIAYAHMQDSLENIIAERDKTIRDWGEDSFKEGFDIVLMKGKNGKKRVINSNKANTSDLNKVDEIQIPYKFKFNDSPTLLVIDKVVVRIKSLDFLKEFRVYPKKVGNKWICQGTIIIPAGNSGLNLRGEAATRMVEISIFNGADRIVTTRKMILVN